MTNDKCDTTLVSAMQIALDKVVAWCDRTGLTVNPDKTVIVPFTRRRRLTLNPLMMGTITLRYSDEVKYLGIYLDRKLTWMKHAEYATNKATRALWACRGLFGKTWGLSPNMVYWLYTTVIRPVLTYARVVESRAEKDYHWQSTEAAETGVPGYHGCL